MQRSAVTIVFGLAAFLGALLLFTVEPLIARMLLPRLGGSPAVWSGCLVFFQVTLLAGYALAHVLSRRLRAGTQVVVVGVALLASLATLPVGLDAEAQPPLDGSPLLWLLVRLGTSVGAVFLALSTLGPLLQRWFSLTSHPEAGDPYFLYALGNLGSLVGLLAYPLLIEPRLPLTGQTGVWSWAYVAVLPLVGAGGWVLLRDAGRSRDEPAATDTGPTGARVSPLRWVVYAFLPSSIMLGATRYMATDLVSFPLLWVVPLALYLLTFVVAFSRRRIVSPERSGTLLAVLALAVVASLWAFVRPPVWLLPVHALTVLAVGLVCHGRLAEGRPHPSRMTGFYLWIGVGGALGGAFNTFVAPFVFDGIVEYPLVLLLACLARPVATRVAQGRRAWLDIAIPAAVALAGWVLWRALAASGIESRVTVALIAIGVPTLLVATTIPHPRRFVLGLAVLLGFAWLPGTDPGETLLRKRTFYGVHKVVRRDSAPFRTTLGDGSERTFVVPHRILYHGTTRHGVQVQDPDLRRVPTSYYHRSGPLGELFRVRDRIDRLENVGVIGLGAGTLAAYDEPPRRFTFYELDPEVARIASDPSLFTFLSDSRATTAIEIGDGRRLIAGAADGEYDLIVVDAFGSDAIPVHLLTREAFELYVRKLAPGGVLALHLTNQYLDLAPVVEALTHDLNLAGVLKSAEIESGDELLEAKDRSTWAVLARERATLEPLAAEGEWLELPLDLPGARRGRYLWTDDYSNVPAVLRW
jgi:hypothetical protein